MKYKMKNLVIADEEYSNVSEIQEQDTSSKSYRKQTNIINEEFDNLFND